MCKKIFISFLLVAVFNLLIGCYSYESLTVPEYNQIEEEDKPQAIQVITKNGQEYSFSDSNFYVASDTLYGKEQLTINEKWIPFEGKLAFNEIEEIEFYSNENKWTYQFSINEFRQIENKPNEIFVIKIDSTKYHFKKNDYYLDRDTLYGSGELLLSERVETLNIKIATSNIQSIDFSERNRLVIGLLFYGSILIVFCIAVGISMSNSDYW